MKALKNNNKEEFKKELKDGLNRLKGFGFIGKNEKHDFLENIKYVQLEKQTKNRLNALRKYWVTEGEEGSVRSFVYKLILVQLSDILFLFSKTSYKAEIVVNSERLRVLINTMLISEFSPIIFRFLKWDFDRRIWNNNNLGNRTNYILKTLSELDAEIEGKGELYLTKYVGLFMEYIMQFYEKALDFFDDIENNQIDENQAFQGLQNIKFFLAEINKGELFDFEQELLSQLKPIAEAKIAGLEKSDGRLDYMLNAFIEGQIQYRTYIKNLMVIVGSNGKVPMEQIKDSLEQNDLDRFVLLIRSVISSLPNQLLKKTNEAYYHGHMHLLLKMIGCDINSEVSTNHGRIDSVIELENHIYIIEFKIGSPEIALEQIKNKKYYEPFLIKQKKVTVLGLAFDKNDRNLIEKYHSEVIYE